MRSPDELDRRELACLAAALYVVMAVASWNGAAKAGWSGLLQWSYVIIAPAVGVLLIFGMVAWLLRQNP